MTQFVVRALLSGVIIALIALIARRNAAAGALVASLPLLSILGMIWLWRDTHDAERITRHVEATFWYVLPSLPMFLLIPWMLRQGHGFVPALLAGCVLTIALYGVTILVAARFGVEL
ncbi:MAG: DUF3147 family protein [Pseudomonadota bacterium]